MVKILYFAGLREAVGTAAEDYALTSGPLDVATLRRQLAERGDGWQALNTTRNLRVAVNQRMADESAPIADGDEVAFFPPVTGG